ncbi:aryl-alcohol dehydrogenase-like predicted oxidoreductase [Dyadobacter sp. BE34]|uniref:Aryl-alcohol dehydrogenase-like predicted oxidoreductase n=1 Tax=Dyadobacter fermentans TaxID=94254 RepID=A0ABU1R4B0_9BACT|nr:MULTISPECIES: aldo/keto reductase [Dyadobacter]MDR6808228.1 aryl-alcohol dehydrogenase-like predicted oxidoreductase [Dyadobacter fermentans]MDR7045956.1 aryl-alcohol dehydrogenase-like predicted oxidoreductase [Dyadobacter sp. BE242]MDR7200269.1 aryl-alcohol dehydrogenase-like predicted oxidoreductase [Dyadobacter sp. BE34]MDR7218229.1 aryl-alcohol dehydrogenase-like predicted oxidoreductase [Dyadobacter sp. BE31]MDR7266160.1 aryl-alcohol dehydrogenase-like predicted oxidoreductase [Dyadob
MQKRRFGRTGWEISEIGYGMWGLAGWTGSDRKETDDSLDLAVESGVNFFDTAWGYGEGLSERILGELIKRNPDKKIYAATKIPPKNRQWPSRSEFALKDVFPADYIVEYTEKSLQNLGTEQIDLLQFHVWEDAWAEEDEWKEAIQKLTQEGKVAAWGISINRWEPDNALKTLETGLIDAVQVIYNIFDQAPEDNLFPLCRKLDIGVIARVPFDEGTLTGLLTKETKFPADDWRSTYFVPENLNASVDHAEALRADIPAGMTMPELALRFILNNPDVHTTIPGMRKLPHVRSNVAVSDGVRLDAAVAEQMKAHRWDRQPTKWSQ